MLSKKSFYYSYILFIHSFCFATTKQSFIIPAAPIKESINKLKEQVADEVQQTLKELTKLQKKTSALLETLADTQRQLLKAGSSIIKEKDQFKKASKESLLEAKKTISRLHMHCNEGQRMMTVLIEDAKKVNPESTQCFGATKKDLPEKKA